MSGQEQLKEYALTFGFGDGEDPFYVNSTIHELVTERYEGVGEIQISEMGGDNLLCFV